MRVLLLGVLLLPPALFAGQRPCPPALWTVDLAKTYQFDQFTLPSFARGVPVRSWYETQKGVVFTSPDRLAVFEVQRLDHPAPLASREGGGGAEFFLHVVFLNANRGEHVRSIELRTPGSGSSYVYPTSAGRFLARTGDTIRLYSPAFDLIASKTFSYGHGALDEDWSVAVNRSGTQIYLDHRAYFGPASPSLHERFLLDADTLQTIATLNPEDYKDWPSRLYFRQWDRRWGGKNGKRGEEAVSFLENGSDLLVEIWRSRWNLLDLDLAPKPLRIVVYDREKKTNRCSIGISDPVSGPFGDTWYNPWGWTYLYAISKTGMIAVIQGNTLSVYHP